jgi:hypothetical protein
MIMMEGTTNVVFVGNPTSPTQLCTLISKQSIIQMARVLVEEEVDLRRIQGRRLTQ